MERTETDELITLGVEPNLFGDQGDDVGGLEDPIAVICFRGRGHERVGVRSGGGGGRKDGIARKDGTIE
jgi:hypothetical protein